MSELEELTVCLSNMGMRYGWWDDKEKKRRFPSSWKDKNFYNKGKCPILRPDEFQKLRVGTCLELSLFEHKWLRDRGLDPHMFYYEWRSEDGSYTSAHAGIYVEYHENYWWIEFAWNSLRGLQGPYKSVNEMIERIKESASNRGHVIYFFDADVDADKLMSLNPIYLKEAHRIILGEDSDSWKELWGDDEQA